MAQADLSAAIEKEKEEQKKAKALADAQHRVDRCRNMVALSERTILYCKSSGTDEMVQGELGRLEQYKIDLKDAIVALDRL